VINYKFKRVHLFTDGAGNIRWEVNIPKQTAMLVYKELVMKGIEIPVGSTEPLWMVVSRKYSIFRFKVMNAKRFETADGEYLKIIIHVPVEDAGKLLSKCAVWCN
jgi:hypothetical protein